MGNKAERFVEDRKKALQSYLRSIVNYLVTNIVSLSCSPDKETLLNLLPFFGDNYPLDLSLSQACQYSAATEDLTNNMDLNFYTTVASCCLLSMTLFQVANQSLKRRYGV